MKKHFVNKFINIPNHNLDKTSDLRRLKAENAELMRLVVDQASQIKMLIYIIRNDLCLRSDLPHERAPLPEISPIFNSTIFHKTGIIAIAILILIALGLVF